MSFGIQEVILNFTHSRHPMALAVLAALSSLQLSAFAQQQPQPTPPNSGTIIQEQPRQIPTLPALGAPEIKTPEFRKAYVGGDIKVRPSAFVFLGNTLLPEAELQAVVANLIGKETDFNGLANAAAALRDLYASKGYVLTDVYFPEQSFSKDGGVVEFQVVEARIGKVSVTWTSGSGVSERFATAFVNHYLVAGAPISQYMLDRPVLLLRDMVGTDADATVVPGANPGEADVLIAIKPSGPKYTGVVGVDDMGVRSSGAIQLAAGGTVNAPLGIGDLLQARIQSSDHTGNTLYRVSYGAAVGPIGDKVTVSASRSEYALGEQFQSLEATGIAQIATLSLIHPLIRGRYSNLFASFSFDRKGLTDNVGQTNTVSDKRILVVHAGLLGNHSDRSLAGATTSYAVTASVGNLHLDAESASQDVGTAAGYGPRTAGNFTKANVELQRVQYLSDRSSILVNMTGQLASKNLTSAEKFSLGGPQGVRGYPIGEGTGDQGLLISAEYRYLTGFKLAGETLSLTAFYDFGKVQMDAVRNSTTQSSVTSPNTLSLDSAGFGFLLGREGDYLATASLSRRISSVKPSTGDPDTYARLWFQLQKWF